MLLKVYPSKVTNSLLLKCGFSWYCYNAFIMVHLISCTYLWRTYVQIYLFTTCSITNSNTTCLERSSYTFYLIYISFLLNLIMCHFVCCLVFSAYSIVWDILVCTKFVCFMALHYLWFNSLCLHVTIHYMFPWSIEFEKWVNCFRCVLLFYLEYRGRHVSPKRR